MSLFDIVSFLFKPKLDIVPLPLTLDTSHFLNKVSPTSVECDNEIEVVSPVLETLTKILDIQHPNDSWDQNPFSQKMFLDITTRFTHVDDIVNIYSYILDSLHNQKKYPNDAVDISGFINDYEYRGVSNVISIGRLIHNSTNLKPSQRHIGGLLDVLFNIVTELHKQYLPLTTDPKHIDLNLPYFDRTLIRFAEDLANLINFLVEIGVTNEEETQWQP